MPAKKKPSARTSKPKTKAKTPAKTSKAKTTKAKTTKAKTTGKKKTPAKAAAASPARGAQTPTAAEVPTPGAPTEHEAAQQEVAAVTTTQPPGMPAPPTPPPKTGVNPLVIVLVVLGVLLLLGLGAIGYFVFAKKDQPTAARVVTSPAPRDTARAAAGSGGCGDATHPEDRVGQLDNGTRHSGSNETVGEATSKPPSSGIHGGGFASNRTIYDTQQPVGNLVHSMDHGSVVIWHKELPKDEYDALSAAANRNAKRSFGALIMVPYDDMDAKIALTAWGSLMKCDGVNDEAIDDFIEEFMATGPEKQVACLGYMPRGHPRCA
jgi:hypothetical protein